MHHTQIIAGNALLRGHATLRVPRGARVVLVGGCFDVLHLGHVTFLARAKARGDILVVALENDAFIQKHKQRPPFHTQKQRAEVLTHLKSVDVVIMLPTMRSAAAYRSLVEKVNPSIIAITRNDPMIDLKRQHAHAVGATVKTVSAMISKLSSSSILQYAPVVHN